MRRVKRRSTADRPMLQGDPAQRIAHLMAERYPVYAEADVTVMSRDVAHETIVNEIIAALAEPLGLARACRIARRRHDRAAARQRTGDRQGGARRARL